MSDSNPHANMDIGLPALEEGEAEQSVEVTRRFRVDGTGQKRIHIRAKGNPGVAEILKMISVMLSSLSDQMEEQEREAIAAMIQQAQSEGRETRTQGGIILPDSRRIRH